MYELSSEKSKTMKLDLAQRVAEMEPSTTGWEKTNADFKL
jgi:trafficking protein particle complex subunit 12